jgi:predicted esterase
MKTSTWFVLFFTVAVVSFAYQPSKTGWLKIQLPALPAPENQAERIQYNYDPKQEFFEIFIPSGYTGAEKYGVLGWVSPDNDANIPKHFESLLNDFKLISITAAQSGNNQDPARRIGLLECAITQLSKTLNLDYDRIIMSGYSGGGRTSAMACFAHSEFWHGAISWVGGNFYKKYSVPMPVGASSPGINDWIPGMISDDQVKASRQTARFVLITGSKDKNLHDSRGIYRALRNENFKAMLIEEPGLAHEIGTAESMRKALDFVLNGKKD